MSQDTLSRIPKQDDAIDEIWRSMTKTEDRTHFLTVALARGRLDVIERASKNPQPVDDFVVGMRKDIRRLIANSENVKAIDAIEALSAPSFATLLDPQGLRDLGALAIQNKSEVVWDKAIACGLNPFENGEMGTTLAHMAVSHDWRYPLDTLYAKYPDKLSAFSDGSSRTLLHTAVKYGHINMVKWLLEIGAEVSARDKNSRTPLYHCVVLPVENQVEHSPNWTLIAGTLLVAGASLDERIGKTARSSTLIERLESISPSSARILASLRTVSDALILDDATPSAPISNRVIRM